MVSILLIVEVEEQRIDDSHSLFLTGCKVQLGRSVEIEKVTIKRYDARAPASPTSKRFDDTVTGNYTVRVPASCDRTFRATISLGLLRLESKCSM
mmetsp:Transcript_9336/g.13702  ORF Transcript_9336/g.13702 Transcript_9336/m.13702 type:complete len:95 (+) Transcript_9336:289-573(+)